MRKVAFITLALGAAVLCVALGLRLAAAAAAGPALDVPPGEGRLDQPEEVYLGIYRSWSLGGRETLTRTQEEAVFRLGLARKSRIIAMELRRRELETLIAAAQSDLNRALATAARVPEVEPPDEIWAEEDDYGTETEETATEDTSDSEIAVSNEETDDEPEEEAGPLQNEWPESEEAQSESISDSDFSELDQAVANLAGLEEEYRTILDKLKPEELEAEKEQVAEVALLAGGADRGAQALLARWGQPFRRVLPGPGLAGLAKKHPLLIVPSGAMDKSLKRSLDGYVRAGGTILAFAQRSGADMARLPGRPRGFGWAEAESAYANSVDVAASHPATASCRKSRFTAAVDGFLTELPKEAEILLRDVRSGQPVAATYRLGQGRVIVTTLYTDWVAVSRQPADMEYLFLRDTALWALAEGRRLHPQVARPGAEIKVVFNVSNESQELAQKVRISYLTPEGVLCSPFEINMKVMPGQTMPATITVHAPKTPGVWHLIYALIRPNGSVLQSWQNAVDVVSADPAPAAPQTSLGASLISSGETVIGDFTVAMHLFNHTAAALSLQCVGPDGASTVMVKAAGSEKVLFHLPGAETPGKYSYTFTITGAGEPLRLSRLITVGAEPRKGVSK